jgi:hypothetical protein
MSSSRRRATGESGSSPARLRRRRFAHQSPHDPEGWDSVALVPTHALVAIEPSDRVSLVPRLSSPAEFAVRVKSEDLPSPKIQLVLDVRRLNRRVAPRAELTVAFPARGAHGERFWKGASGEFFAQRLERPVHGAELSGRARRRAIPGRVASRIWRLFGLTREVSAGVDSIKTTLISHGKHLGWGAVKAKPPGTRRQARHPGRPR